MRDHIRYTQSVNSGLLDDSSPNRFIFAIYYDHFYRHLFDCKWLFKKKCFFSNSLACKSSWLLLQFLRSYFFFFNNKISTFFFQKKKKNLWLLNVCSACTPDNRSLWALILVKILAISFNGSQANSNADGCVYGPSLCDEPHRSMRTARFSSRRTHFFLFFFFWIRHVAWLPQWPYDHWACWPLENNRSLIAIKS